MMKPFEYQAYIDQLFKDKGNDWPAQALERLLQLTANLALEEYQVEAGAIDQATLDAHGSYEAQQERWALKQWALDVIEAGIAFRQSPY